MNTTNDHRTSVMLPCLPPARRGVLSTWFIELREELWRRVCRKYLMKMTENIFYSEWIIYLTSKTIEVEDLVLCQVFLYLLLLVILQTVQRHPHKLRDIVLKSWFVTKNINTISTFMSQIFEGIIFLSYKVARFSSSTYCYKLLFCLLTNSIPPIILTLLDHLFSEALFLLATLFLMRLLTGSFQTTYLNSPSPGRPGEKLCLYINL